MPDGRFLSKTVSLSRQLASVPLEAAFLFTWMIPHLDVDGRMLGDEVAVKASAVPIRPEFTIDTIREALLALARAPRDQRRRPLLYWYELHGQRYLEFPGFRDHQRGMRVKREAKSRLPGHAHDGAVDLTRVYLDHSGSTPAPAPGVVPAQVPAERRLSEVKNFTVEDEHQGAERGDAPGGALPLASEPEGEPTGLTGQALLDRKQELKAQIATLTVSRGGAV